MQHQKEGFVTGMHNMFLAIYADDPTHARTLTGSTNNQPYNLVIAKIRP